VALNTGMIPFPPSLLASLGIMRDLVDHARRGA
jgi:hypothetical protein